MRKNGSQSARDEIIQRAVLEKLSNGINFFSADDILAVAEIDDAQLTAIAEGISRETQKVHAAKDTRSAKKKPVSKRKNKPNT